jgi:KaiC/GvpD/RAD55 family RecA-like ATPase
MNGRLTTGLSGLDAQLGGGVPGGTVHLLIGEPMNALELFCQHFSAGAGSTGGALYVSTQATEDEIKAGIDMVGGKRDKVDVHMLPHGKSWDPPDVPKGKRYVLDSFSNYVLAVGWDKAFPRLEELKKQVRGGTGNLLIVVTPNLVSDKEMALLKLWADGVLELGFDRQGFGLYPYLKVTKMRGVPDSSRFLLFKETEKGLFMESTRRVF